MSCKNYRDICGIKYDDEVLGGRLSYKVLEKEVGYTKWTSQILLLIVQLSETNLKKKI